MHEEWNVNLNPIFELHVIKAESDNPLSYFNLGLSFTTRTSKKPQFINPQSENTLRNMSLPEDRLKQETLRDENIDDQSVRAYAELSRRLADTEAEKSRLEAELKHLKIYNKMRYSRYAFSLAHELGHYFLRHQAGENGFFLRHTEDREHNSKNQEKEANEFAAELLAPVDEVRAEFEKNRSIGNIAKNFGVSQRVIQAQISKIGYGFI